MFTLTQILFVAVLVGISYLAGFFIGSKDLLEKAYFFKKRSDFLTVVADITLEELTNSSELSEKELTDLISEKVKIKLESL